MGEGRSRLLREPLLHFAAAGALLFLAQALWAPRDASRIVVTREAQGALATAREDLLMRPLTAEEREHAISDYVDEEVLLREAYREGLDRDDPRIRRWLVEKMEFLIDEEPPEPTPEDLDMLFQKNPEAYKTPLAVSFDHVFFSSEAPPSILDRLRGGADFTALGDDFWLGKSLRRFSELELSTTFGVEFTSRVLALPIGEWSGPIASSRGEHFVRVIARHEPELQPRKDVEWTLREDWLRARRAESRARKLDELRARYEIEIE